MSPRSGSHPISTKMPIGQITCTVIASGEISNDNRNENITYYCCRSSGKPDAQKTSALIPGFHFHPKSCIVIDALGQSNKQNFNDNNRKKILSTLSAVQRHATFVIIEMLHCFQETNTMCAIYRILEEKYK